MAVVLQNHEGFMTSGTDLRDNRDPNNCSDSIKCIHPAAIQNPLRVEGEFGVEV
jgi:hypothetical protein